METIYTVHTHDETRYEGPSMDDAIFAYKEAWKGNFRGTRVYFTTNTVEDGVSVEMQLVDEYMIGETVAGFITEDDHD